MDVIKWIMVLTLLLAAPGCSRGGETIRQGALTYNVVDIFGDTPALALARAAARGDVAAVKAQIGAGVDPNTVGKHDITPLWWAAWAESLDGFEALLESGANPNLQRQEGFSLMTLVTRMRNPRFLELALTHGGDPNFREAKSSETPIFEAIMYSGSDRQRQLLLQAGANLDAQSVVGWTPMMQAVATRGDYKLVWEFLQRGADYRLQTINGKTLADFIGTCRIIPHGEPFEYRKKVIEFLRSKGIDAHPPPSE